VGLRSGFKLQGQSAMKSPLFSVVIPVKEINDYLRLETVPSLLKQSYSGLEIIILPDKKTNEHFPQTRIIPTLTITGPAAKRDMGAKAAKGQILAFIDDDAYPEKNWLKTSAAVFAESDSIAAVCGPAVTPATDNFRQKASGYVWSSWLGSGGAGTYRCTPQKRRQVDDYPSVNLLVRKKDFFEAGGFDCRFYPGEDTKLCLEITKKLSKKIIYDPKILVYHHRREVFRPHLKQISRYAVHRGYFARVFPQTSFRPGYFVPTLFVGGLVVGLPLAILIPILSWIYYPVLLFYLLWLVVVAHRAGWKEKSFPLALLVGAAIFLTHLVYGTLFVKGYLSAKLDR